MQLRAGRVSSKNGRGTRRRKVVSMPTRFEDLPLLMTPKQLAEATGEHVNSIRRSVAAGRIPADKVDGRIYICRDQVFPNIKKGMVSDDSDASAS